MDERRFGRTRRLAAGALTLGALCWAACTAPKNEDGEVIDPREAQPREAVVRTPDEIARDANFKDLRRRRPLLSEPNR